MQTDKSWNILNKSQIKNVKDLTRVLFKNREIKTKKEIEEFLDPKLENVTTGSVGINKKQLKKAVERISLAIKNKEQIVVFGDYDVDGICGSAILWETLNVLRAKVTPYIPHRIDEGYGLSETGIQNSEFRIKNCKLIITVDNGIVANKAVDFANKKGIDVIVTDHHVPSNPTTGSGLPKALAIVHTTKLCGTGVAYLLANGLWQMADGKKSISHNPYAISHLELVALATVADLVPLKWSNRTLLKFGLASLNKTKRIGLLELFKEAGLEKQSIGVYEIGHMIAPRLNAMGRLEYAMDSLRLICTNNQKRAENLARLLGSTNRERQDLTLQTVLHAKEQVETQKSPLRPAQRDFAGQAKLKNLLFIAHESYEQGVIGLVAGKMVEEFYRPTIVVSIGEKLSKASARSINGFNIIEFIREHSALLVDAGGHPMAAGFTVKTSKLLELQKALEDRAELILNKDLLTRSLKIDCELPLSFVDLNLYESLQKLAPFGMGNPEPTFISKGVMVEDIRLVGAEGKHLKLKFRIQNSEFRIDGIGFGMGALSSKIHIGDKVDIVYTIDENEWNGEKRLQLKVKDLLKK